MPGLGAAEAEILQIVWQLGEATVQEIHDALPAERQIALGTVQTVLRRLREKGYVQAELQGKAYVFSSAMQPDRVISTKVSELINRFFGGKALPLVMHLAKSRKLTERDIKRLRQLLDEEENDSSSSKEKDSEE